MLDSSLLSAIYPGLNFMLWVAFSENIFAISDIVFCHWLEYYLVSWFKKTSDGGASSTADEEGIRKNKGYEETEKSWP